MTNEYQGMNIVQDWSHALARIYVYCYYFELDIDISLETPPKNLGLQAQLPWITQLNLSISIGSVLYYVHLRLCIFYV